MQPMTHKQIEALRVTLARYGLGVTKLRQRCSSGKSAVAAVSSDNDELKERIARVQAMTFKTANVKSTLLRTLRNFQKNGHWWEGMKAYNYQARGSNGSWYSENDGALFDAAVAYQKTAKGYRNQLHRSN